MLCLGWFHQKIWRIHVRNGWNHLLKQWAYETKIIKVSQHVFFFAIPVGYWTTPEVFPVHGWTFFSSWIRHINGELQGKSLFGDLDDSRFWGWIESQMEVFLELQKIPSLSTLSCFLLGISCHSFWWIIWFQLRYDEVNVLLEKFGLKFFYTLTCTYRP